jgi:hypothetical protein
MENAAIDDGQPRCSVTAHALRRVDHLVPASKATVAAKLRCRVLRLIDCDGNLASGQWVQIVQGRR